MPSVHAHAVSYSFSQAVTVLHQVDLNLGPGWYGVVSANGAGKSTLLRLLAGDVMPTAGQVVVLADVPAVLCPQDVGDADAAIADFASRWDGAAARLRGQLQLQPDDVARWPTLSPGQRKRWQIGAALVTRPDVLLLDEPTNHLDVEGRRLLLRALQRFDGVGLVVSHDRELLDAVTSVTLRVHAGRVESWVGAYSTARSLWQVADDQARSRHERLRAEQRKALRQLDQARRTRAAAEQSMTAERRKAHAGDREAGSMGQKYRMSRAEKGLAQTVAARRSRVDRADQAAVAATDVRGDIGGDVRFAACSSGLRWIAEVDTDALYAGAAPLLHSVHVAVRSDHRIHVRGPNGAGKTTLLQAVVDAARLARDRVAFLPQELDATAIASLLDQTAALPAQQRGDVLSLVARLGVDPDRLLASAAPSPGEVRKLALAYALARRAELVALDEPTNHLDLPSIERLQEALAQFPGALLLVTHDERLAKRVATATWTVGDGRVEVTQGR